MDDDKPSQPAEESKPSLWERLGRTTGKGFRAAKAIGDRIELKAEASQRLDDCYRRLGRVVADQLGSSASGSASSLSGDDPAIRQLLEEIEAVRKDREQLESDDSATSQ